MAADDIAHLAQLEGEEQSISIRRRRLHDRIDFIRSGRAVDSPDAEAQLERLIEEEKGLSARRRTLHAEIDTLRQRLGQDPGAKPRHKRIGD